MVKIVYDGEYNGMCVLSHEGALRLLELGVEEMREVIKKENEEDEEYRLYMIPDEVKRHDHRLVRVVEELKERANGPGSLLKIKMIEGDRYMVVEDHCFERVVVPEDFHWIIIEDH